MECNRDEAVRARDIAESKYGKQDFAGAKKFVLKAQQLFPGLEGLSQMLQVLEVHSVAQVKLGNEMDWYGILQVDPSADDNSIKRQYRKLALQLHPDKNKAMGAEAAFKLIGEAWGVLSDKPKRAVHDMKRGLKNKASHVRVAMDSNAQAFPTQTPYAPPPTTPNPPQPQQHSNQNSTFWTACPGCKMQYQYLRTYENYSLQCPKCKNVFLARDIHHATNNNGSGGFAWHFESQAQAQAQPQRQDFTFNKQPQPAGAAEFNGAAHGHGFMNGGSFSFPSNQANNNTTFFSNAAAAAAAQSKVAAAAAAAAAASSALPNNLAADVVNQTYAKVKRERVEAEKETKRKEKEMRKKEKDELRKEKEDQRKEKEDQRRARETEREEAMERLVAKRKEHITRDESKRKGDSRSGRKLKRKRRSSDQEDDEELEDVDPRSYEQGMPDDQSSPLLPRRRSSRAKKNVATYKFEMSDDSDLERTPAGKRVRSDGEENPEDAMKSDDESGRETVAEESENGSKGKSVAHDSNHVKRSVGASGGEEFIMRKHISETNDQGHATPTKKDLHKSKVTEPSKREAKLHDSPSTPFRTRLGKSSQQAETPPPTKENDNEGEKLPKAEGFREVKSPAKSPRTLRMRVKSPTPKEPFGTQCMSNEEDQIPQQPISSPAPSAPSTPASEGESEGEEEQFHIPVPDPDFYDFDKNRTEEDVMVGQIWAIYDDQDGMPRYYARISKLTTKPFKATMCWLEHISSDEETSWSEETGLSITCGDFKMGKSMVMDQINTFSHIVAEKSARGAVRVYPRRGQVWAVYRDWDPVTRIGPKRLRKPTGTGDGPMYLYTMVEILEDVAEDKRVRTARLEKVGGFKTVFRRQDGADDVYFPFSDLMRFSHGVPNQLIVDKDADSMGIPRGSLELDPASTPMYLLESASDTSR